MAARIKNGDFERGAKVVLLGCNEFLFAKELSVRLTKLGRGDITVYGADSSVFGDTVATVDSRQDPRFSHHMYLRQNGTHYLVDSTSIEEVS